MADLAEARSGGRRRSCLIARPLFAPSELVVVCVAAAAGVVEPPSSSVVAAFAGGPASPPATSSSGPPAFNVASANTNKRRVLYLLDEHHALRFLGNRRAIASVLSKNASVHDRFRMAHQDEFATAASIGATVEERVEIVDLRDLVPAFSGAMSDHQTSAVPKDPLK
jgi:hypothetical protein